MSFSQRQISLLPLSLMLCMWGAHCSRQVKPKWPKDVVLTLQEERQTLSHDPYSSPQTKDTNTIGQQSTAPDSAADSSSISDTRPLQLVLRFQNREKIPPLPDAMRWPAQLEKQWNEFHGQVNAIINAPKQTSTADLHRIRITLEAEFQRDRYRYGTAPLDLAKTNQELTEKTVKLIALRRFAKPDSRSKPQANAKTLIFQWPLQNPSISSFYGYRQDPINPMQRRFHAGIDFASPFGKLVRASAPGLVIRAGWAGGHGKSVSIKHPGGYISVYSHLSTILTDIGIYVDALAPIGLIGDTGRATGPHLHFEVHDKYGQTMDPLEVLDVPIKIKVSKTQ